MPSYTYEELSGGSPQENADLLRAILAGKERGARRDMVLANAAAALLVGGKVGDLRAGVKLAAELIDSGAARKKLDELDLWSRTGSHRRANEHGEPAAEIHGGIGGGACCGQDPLDLRDQGQESRRKGTCSQGETRLPWHEDMESAGAACLSVVTESRHFGGSLELLRSRGFGSLVAGPAQGLRDRPRRSAGHQGARCVLPAPDGGQCSIGRSSWNCTRKPADAAWKRWSRSTTRRNSHKALTLDLDLLGINNRDIRQLETDNGTVANTLRLLRMVPPRGPESISESSISTPEEVRAVLAAGGLGVLVGTSILRARDVAEGVRRLVRCDEWLEHGSGQDLRQHGCGTGSACAWRPARIASGSWSSTRSPCRGTFHASKRAGCFPSFRRW